MSAKTYLWYHIIVTTKYRRPRLVSPMVLAAVRASAIQQTNIRRGEIFAINHGEDLAHVHVLVCLPPNVPLAAWVRDFKSQSARRANAVLRTTGKPFWGVRYWARSVGGGDLAAARKYVVEQWHDEVTGVDYDTL